MLLTLLGSKDIMLRYDIILLIKHPCIDPVVISRQLGLIPFRYWKFGELRTTPTGTPLEGVWQDTAWIWRLQCKGKREFFKRLSTLVLKLEPHGEFLSNLVLEGGNICLGVNLQGKTNIGDVLSWQLMEKLVNLKIDIGIEVFPNWND